MNDLLDAVKGVMVLNINGHRHLELASPSLDRGMPTYVDKPMTCSLDQAKVLLEKARSSKARAYSASSLRFVEEIEKLDFQALGPIVAIDAFGNGELLDMMPHLWHYGCHSIEMVDAIFKRSGQGAGVARRPLCPHPDGPQGLMVVRRHGARGKERPAVRGGLRPGVHPPRRRDGALLRRRRTPRPVA
jgi:predicted dehydrogenase